MRSNHTMQHATQRHQHTPQLVQALNRRRDPVDDQKKATGFKVFVNAFESYHDDGYSGIELQNKAMSQYTNWAAQEWEKPHDFSADQIPFYRSTFQSKFRRKSSGGGSALPEYRINKNKKQLQVKHRLKQ